MKTNRKIMFFDIDGTLLSETTHTIPKSTITAIRKAKEKNHLIFINTGRPLSTIDQCIKDLQPDGYVCGCGTYINYQGKELLSSTVKESLCKDIVNLIHRTNVEGVLEGKNAVYFKEENRHPFVKEIKQVYINNGFLVNKITDTNVSFDKFAIWYDNQSDIETFKQGIAQDFEYIVRGPDFLEIVPHGYSKATGIKYLLQYFNIDINDCYVFGDSMNDRAMLEYVKHAIVMGNGEPELFQHAYYVTKDIDEDGIYHALEHLELI